MLRGVSTDQRPINFPNREASRRNSPDASVSRTVGIQASSTAVNTHEQAFGKLELDRSISFLIFHGYDFRSLYLADQRARRLGEPALRVLISDGILSETDYACILGLRLGAAVVTKATPDGRTGLEVALRQGWCRATLESGVPVMLVAASGILAPALLSIPEARRAGRIALATTGDFRAILNWHFSSDIAAEASATVPGKLSARTGATRPQLWLTSAFLAFFIAGCLVMPDGIRLGLPLVLGLFFLGSSVVILSACIEGAPAGTRLIEWDDARLPRYSVLVPLYREAAVVADLVAALAKIDYPPEKLQILLVIEEGDNDTRDALVACAPPPHISVFAAPPGIPKTKPRAINTAMRFVTGDLVVVYDAEDRPEPTQLRAAAAAFRTAPGSVVCLQARLAIDNTGDSWLTRMFTIEYAALFDVVKAGNARMGLPVPLGGTSNHFRIRPLRELGLWDAWNVTEDADLGFRLAMAGYQVDDLPSTTDEEAPNRFEPWLHQRRRWLKGWMQTIVSHSRAPMTAWHAMGTVNFLAAVSMSAGVVAGALGAPFFHWLVLMRVLSDEPFGGGDLLTRAADAVIIVLGVTGLGAMLIPAVMGLVRRKLYRLLPWVLLIPVYQMLVSYAAWLALYDLIVSPHSWNKTMHGLALTSRSRNVQKQ